MTEHVNFLKPDPVPCGCGCGLVGQLRVKAHRDGTHCVKRGCPCNRCKGKKSRDKGDRKALAARKALAIPGANTRHEELLGGTVRWEAKAGAQIKPMWSAFLRAEMQSEQARAHGDSRPFVMTAAADGQSDQLVSFRLSRLDDVLIGLAEQRGLIA